MKLSLINQIWLEKTAAQYGVPPEALLNAVIRLIRERDESGIQKLEDWLNASEKARQQSGALLEEVRASRGVAEESVFSLRVYLMRLEKELKRTSVGPT